MTLQILIAEPDKSTRSVLQSSLQTAGFQVIQASDGDAAWELLQTQMPMLMLMSASLPGLTSRDMLMRIRTRHGITPLPIIVLGNEISTEEMVQWFQLGADNYISKPFSMPVLVAQVRSLLRRVKA
ncbi:MAG: response regulator transcription factor [Chloroflexi bacterium]|nr:response regulator transcription factor [Chloroflexota bacterium]